MATTDKTPTQDLHVDSMTLLTSPDALKAELPMSDEIERTVVESREQIIRILTGEDDRMLVVMGPCSIHDIEAASEYAHRLNELRQKVEDTFYIAMRVYFEKPRTTVGWKGLINDPHLDGTFDMGEGLRQARKLLLEVAGLGLPTATEVLDPITPQYIDDALSWAAIGARTTESQTHRQMASGLSMPVGYKNSTTGDFDVALNAMHSARNPHAFLGIDGDGRTCLVRTTGNPWGHLILRGGQGKPNYDPENVDTAVQALKDAGLPTGLMVDCSHANSGKKHERQEVVFNSIIDQRSAGNQNLNGMMIESNLNPGNQKLTDNPAELEYGVSITDACIGWEKTESLLLEGARRLKG
ncbi:MAG: 3-deoxy-7-phosphoheptulonate synthase [Phycisphaeraceae bacterium]|nr:3-deoxy-7-phosphoheptulonate synthase [Phycisphaeraceae bacterium]